jgi:hypothetical protein
VRRRLPVRVPVCLCRGHCGVTPATALPRRRRVSLLVCVRRTENSAHERRPRRRIYGRRNRGSHFGACPVPRRIGQALPPRVIVASGANAMPHSCPKRSKSTCWRHELRTCKTARNVCLEAGLRVGRRRVSFRRERPLTAAARVRIPYAPLRTQGSAIRADRARTRVPALPGCTARLKGERFSVGMCQCGIRRQIRVGCCLNIRNLRASVLPAARCILSSTTKLAFAGASDCAIASPGCSSHPSPWR